MCAPTTVYGAAKPAGEYYTQAYERTFGLPVTIVRPFNCYGPRAHHQEDLAEAVGLLETIANFRRLFGEIHRVLRPSGTVAGITSNGECSWYRLRKFIEGGERHGRTRQLATARSLNHVLQQC